MVDVVKLPPGYSYGYNSCQVLSQEKTDIECMSDLAISLKTTPKRTVYVKDIINNYE